MNVFQQSDSFIIYAQCFINYVLSDNFFNDLCTCKKLIENLDSMNIFCK